MDVDIPFEKPINCEMTVETDKDNPENIIGLLNVRTLNIDLDIFDCC